ncbi:UDP:flavonoid glycosyltransferase YjiC (YdhE family) [Pedobacter sp. CG_S7]|uniref:glycosyltransferase n=1 Tax=Pedobacter sp. CG_S7 TaxID=3143930 RepID=UPI00339B68F3
MNKHTIKKVILFFPFNLLSHYLRCLVLADTYDKNVYEIYFISSGTYDHFVLDHGYKTFNCLQFDEQYVMQCSTRFDFSWLSLPELERIMLAQVASIKELKASIAIGDVAPTLKMATTLTDIEHISLLNGYMTRYYAHSRKISRTHKTFFFIKFLPEVLAELLTNMGEKIAFKKIQQPFNDLRLKYGLLSMPNYLFEIEGNVNLICDLPVLFPQENLPPAYQFIGPLVYQYQEQDDTWLDDIPAGKPVICVSLGSTGDWNKLRFLNNSYYSKYTIVTTGDKEKVLSAAHILSRGFVNLNQVLKLCDLMICHGGNGTIYHGIFNHVYMLCHSSNFEQEWNISALEKGGYGKSADNFDEDKWRFHIAAHCSVPYLY